MNLEVSRQSFRREETFAYLNVEVNACDRPRYVFFRKENWNWSFWQILTSVPVVLRPYVRTESIP